MTESALSTHVPVIDVRARLHRVGPTAWGGLVPHRQVGRQRPWHGSDWAALWVLDGLPRETAKRLERWIVDSLAEQLWGVRSAYPLLAGAPFHPIALDAGPLWVSTAGPSIKRLGDERAVVAYRFSDDPMSSTELARVARIVADAVELIRPKDRPRRECLWIRTVSLEQAELLASLSDDDKRRRVREGLPAAEQSAFDLELALAQARFRDDLLGLRDHRAPTEDGNPLIPLDRSWETPADPHVWCVTRIEDAVRLCSSLGKPPPASIELLRLHSVHCHLPPANFGVADAPPPVPPEFMPDPVDEHGEPLFDDYREAQWRVHHILRQRRGEV